MSDQAPDAAKQLREIDKLLATDAAVDPLQKPADDPLLTTFKTMGAAGVELYERIIEISARQAERTRQQELEHRRELERLQVESQRELAKIHAEQAAPILKFTAWVMIAFLVASAMLCAAFVVKEQYALALQVLTFVGAGAAIFFAGRKTP